MGSSPLHMPVAEILRLYRKKQLSPVEVAAGALKQILKYNPVLNALCYMDEKAVLRQAKISEKRWMRGMPDGLLDGITVTIKDAMHVKGWPTRFGSKTASALKQQEDAPAVARLREEGALFIGKTTLPEYGHKGVTHGPLTGITRNPWNVNKTPGGSSGGAAVAAATGMAMLNLGSDAGGSIRIPSSFSGVFGFKPSPGLVSAYPPSIFASLSSQGPIVRYAEDAALMMDVIARTDTRDFNRLPLPQMDFAKSIEKLPKKLRIAVATSINGLSVTPEVLEVFKAKMKTFEHVGEVEEIVLHAPKLTDVFNKHWMAFASYIVAGVPKKMRKDMDPRLLNWASRGDAEHLHEYLQAEYDRMTIGQYFKDLLTTYDLLVTPTTAMTAFETGIDMPFDRNGKPWGDWTPFTYPANLAKLPAASLPIGLSKEGLPVGLQIMGGFLQDILVLQAAHRLEQEIKFTPWLESRNAI